MTRGRVQMGRKACCPDSDDLVPVDGLARTLRCPTCGDLWYFEDHQYPCGVLVSLSPGQIQEHATRLARPA